MWCADGFGALRLLVGCWGWLLLEGNRKVGDGTAWGRHGVRTEEDLR
jgi:hypothetical protein